jgi:predicted nucleic acid-binding protein
MSATVFVDTNVLVHARDSTEADKQRQAAEWMAWLWELRLGRLSVQVLQEYYVTVTTKLHPPREVEEAREDVIALTAWQPVVIDLDIIERAWSLQDRFGFSWWDGLILGAALARRCGYVLSEDFQDGQRIDGLRILNPFANAPSAILEAG